MSTETRKFEPGMVVATPNAVATFGKPFIAACLSRHLRGDWGESLDSEDVRANEAALKAGDRLLSVYARGKARLYAITEADRAATTFLLPDEY